MGMGLKRAGSSQLQLQGCCGDLILCPVNKLARSAVPFFWGGLLLLGSLGGWLQLSKTGVFQSCRAAGFAVLYGDSYGAALRLQGF